MEVYGWKDFYGINKNYFATIYPVKAENSSVELPDSMRDIVVIGKIVSDDEATSVNWESGLEGANAESGFSMTAAIMQSGIFEKTISGGNSLSGMTLLNKTNSIQIFKGVEPKTLNLTLEFIARADAWVEVEAPLQYLYKFQSPQLRDGIASTAVDNFLSLFDSGKVSPSDAKAVMGDVPFDIVVVCGDKRYSNGTFILESVSSSRDELALTKDGNSTKRQVSLTLKSKQSLMRDDIATSINII